MDKKQAQEINSEILLTDLLIRVSTLEKLLINKGFITQEEFTNTMKETAFNIMKDVLQKANVPGDLDKILNDMQK